MTEASQLLIPGRIRVGFNRRADTYTGILGYVIYYDACGKLRKEKSFDGWRDATIAPVEYDNEPTEGFVINKDVGGHRRSWSHHGRAERVRVWDPRGHEFEISIENLLFILREVGCDPGKGLEGKFVYAWDKNPSSPPVLLPITSLEYKNCQVFTGLQSTKFKARDLVPGHTYITRRQKVWVYLGRFDYYYAIEHRYRDASKDDPGAMKKHVFAEQAGDKWTVHYQNDVKAVAALASSSIPENFADLVELHTHSARGSRIARLITKPVERAIVPTHSYGYYRWAYQIEPGVFADAATEFYDSKPKKTCLNPLYGVANGVLQIRVGRESAHCFHPDYRDKQQRYFPAQVIESTPHSPNAWIEPTTDMLFAVLECGTEVPIDSWSLRKDR